ncbi:MAG: arginase family protein [Candidatus Aenigmarchaeota archaeon]|nr:arginase family protein [Candidatus Aenigmarchaeota archaeon]
MKLAWSNAKSYDCSDVVVIGVPDDSGSHSKRRGSSKAPDTIRHVSHEREVFFRGGAWNVAAAQTGEIKSKIFDRGNVRKKDVEHIAYRSFADGKMLVSIGGDHSITSEVLRGMNKVDKKISVVYFDSHPDFVCSTRGYYGSVVCDIREFRNVDFSSSIEVGMRQPETEELRNIDRGKLKTITPIEIEEMGVEHALKIIKKKVGRNVYVSLDMDVVDPAFAPAVSTPVPGGISSLQMVYLMKGLAEKGLIGFDLVEICPKYDVQHMTSHLAARIIAETVASSK